MMLTRKREICHAWRTKKNSDNPKITAVFCLNFYFNKIKRLSGFIF
jgi:hypothetical protein